MGSYISIVNDTLDPMACNVGTDMPGVAVFGIVISVIASLGAVVATAGAAAPLLTFAEANDVVAIMGLSTTATICNRRDSCRRGSSHRGRCHSCQFSKNGGGAQCPGRSTKWIRLNSAWRETPVW
jgi:hypothetical protein